MGSATPVAARATATVGCAPSLGVPGRARGAPLVGTPPSSVAVPRARTAARLQIERTMAEDRPGVGAWPAHMARLSPHRAPGAHGSRVADPRDATATG